MSHEVAHAELEIDANEADDMHEAMDYAQHRATWDGFTNMVKWAIIELAFLVLALFCFIEAGQPLVGAALIIIGLLAIPANMLFGKRA